MNVLDLLEVLPEGIDDLKPMKAGRKSVEKPKTLNLYKTIVPGFISCLETPQF